MLDIDNEVEIEIGTGIGSIGETTGPPTVLARGKRLAWVHEFFALEELDSFIAELVKAGHPDTKKVEEVREEFAGLLRTPTH
ncbi:MAG TPA: hypothetical protein VMW75_27345 [Thermoanaerobaculia bacterium]|nr:hypothetical protein [Thermoanaerobaculia bacterium]